MVRRSSHNAGLVGKGTSAYRLFEATDNNVEPRVVAKHGRFLIVSIAGGGVLLIVARWYR